MAVMIIRIAKFVMKLAVVLIVITKILIIIVTVIMSKEMFMKKIVFLTILMK